MLRFVNEINDKINDSSEIIIYGDTPNLTLTKSLIKNYRTSLADKTITVIDITGEIETKNTNDLIGTLNCMIREFWNTVGLDMEDEQLTAKEYLKDINNSDEIKQTAKDIYDCYSSQLPITLPFVKKFIDKFLNGKISLKCLKDKEDINYRNLKYYIGSFPILDTSSNALLIFNASNKIYKANEFDFIFNTVLNRFNYIIIEDRKTSVKIYDIIRHINVKWHRMDLQLNKRDNIVNKWCIVNDK